MKNRNSGSKKILKLLESVERLVVKVGTNLIDGESGFNLPMLAGLASDLANLRKRGKQVILVTSGAVGAGRRIVGIEGYPKTIPVRQACAALGQTRLMHFYQELFQFYNCQVAQVLLTEDAITDRRRYLNARNTLDQLLSWDVIPIINENDTVATDELKFGDNDRLSALVASKVRAQLLILLTDVDGLYDQPPATGKGVLIECVERLTPEIRGMAGSEGSNYSIGGMKAKLAAADIAMRSGVLMAIANGNRPGIVGSVVEGVAPATWFLPSEAPLSSKKSWLASGQRVCKGKLLVDNGAAEALLNGGKSLLPIGVKAIHGTFAAGDLVSICDPAGKEIARGLVNYSSEDLQSVAGRQTSKIREILALSHVPEVVHRDDLVTMT